MSSSRAEGLVEFSKNKAVIICKRPQAIFNWFYRLTLYIHFCYTVIVTVGDGRLRAFSVCVFTFLHHGLMTTAVFLVETVCHPIRLFAMVVFGCDRTYWQTPTGCSTWSSRNSLVCSKSQDARGAISSSPHISTFWPSHSAKCHTISHTRPVSLPPLSGHHSHSHSHLNISTNIPC